jgi:hypothetical protein
VRGARPRGIKRVKGSPAEEYKRTHKRATRGEVEALRSLGDDDMVSVSKIVLGFENDAIDRFVSHLLTRRFGTVLIKSLVRGLVAAKRDGQESFNAYEGRASSAHASRGSWRSGLYEHASGKRMVVRPCNWISDGAYGEVYWLGVDPDSGEIIPLGASKDCLQEWSKICSLAKYKLDRKNNGGSRKDESL